MILAPLLLRNGPRHCGQSLAAVALMAPARQVKRKAAVNTSARLRIGFIVWTGISHFDAAQIRSEQ
jgi:hypothetical protein